MIRFRNTRQIICNRLPVRTLYHLRHDLHRLPPHHNHLRRRDGILCRARSVSSVARSIIFGSCRVVRKRIGRRDRISTGLRRGKLTLSGDFIRNRCTVSRNRIGNRNRLRRNTCRALGVALPVKQRRLQLLRVPIRHVLPAQHQLLLAGGDHVDGVALRLRLLKHLAAAVDRRHHIDTGGGGFPVHGCLSMRADLHRLRHAAVAGGVDDLKGDGAINRLIACVLFSHIRRQRNRVAVLVHLNRSLDRFRCVIHCFELELVLIDQQSVSDL